MRPCSKSAGGAGQSRLSGGTTVPEDRALSPDDWPHPAERRYADAQARLADDTTSTSSPFDLPNAGVLNVTVVDQDGDPVEGTVTVFHGTATRLTGSRRSPTSIACTLPTDPVSAFRPLRATGPGTRSIQVTSLLELLDAFGIDRPHMVGNSHGGLQSFLLAITTTAWTDWYWSVPGRRLAGPHAPVSSADGRGLNRVLRGCSTAATRLRTRGSRCSGSMSSTARPSLKRCMNCSQPGRPCPAGRRASGRWRRHSYRRPRYPRFDIRNEIVRIDRATQFVWGTEDAFYPQLWAVPLLT